MDVLVDLIVVIMSPSGSPVTHLHPPPLSLATSSGLRLGTSHQDGYYNCLPQLTLLKKPLKSPLGYSQIKVDRSRQLSSYLVDKGALRQLESRVRHRSASIHILTGL